MCVPFPDTSRAGRALASQHHPDSFSASRLPQGTKLTSCSGSFATFSSVFARVLSSVSSDLQKKDENAIFRGYSWFPVKQPMSRKEGRAERKKMWKRKEGFAERRSEQVSTVSAQNP